MSSTCYETRIHIGGNVLQQVNRNISPEVWFSIYLRRSTFWLKSTVMLHLLWLTWCKGDYSVAHHPLQYAIYFCNIEEINVVIFMLFVFMLEYNLL